MRRRSVPLLRVLAVLLAVGCGGGDDAPPDDKLSDYGFFVGDGHTQEPAPGVIPYDVNAPLFSDYTAKHRFLRVPPGMKIHYDALGAWTFPVGTALVKTFAYPIDERDPALGERLLETRVLRLDATEGWIADTYVWNDEQTEATRVVAGKRFDVSWIDATGATQTNAYRVPNANQCLNCHGEKGATHLLGPRTRQLNRDHDYGAGPENQIDHLDALGLFDGPVPPLADRMTLPDPLDATVAIETRARTYLEANCAHCHNENAPAESSGLLLSLETTALIDLGVCRSPFSAGDGTGNRPFDIVPGEPDNSVMMFRVESTDPAIHMPEIGANLVDTAGAAILREWIQQMTPVGCM